MSHVQSDSPTSVIVRAEPMDRRSFLQRLGLGAATVFVIADGVVSYRAWDQGVLSESEGPAFEALENWQSFSGPQAAVAAALLAANAHNTQPWAFAIDGEQIDVYADRTRATGANDPLYRELHISLGCAIENLVLAARANGYAATVQLDPQTSTDLVATVTLTMAGALPASDLYAAIGQRRSNRSEFAGDPISDAVKASMSSLAEPGADLRWLDDGAARAGFAALLVEATRAHNDDDEQSRASFVWWRNDRDQIQQHKDGLNIDGVGLSPLIRTLGRLLPGTGRAAADTTFLERTEIQAESAAAFGIIAVQDPYSLEQQLIGGRFLQRLHLWAAGNGIGFQHMNQITERIDRDRQLANPPVFEQPLAALAGPGTLAAFRVGTPTLDSMPSPRRPVAEVLR